uniref:NCS2 family permease n=1 Tax=Schlesneria paludicola TaxID=360056 RepID=A0A7C4LLW2_9PLAN
MSAASYPVFVRRDLDGFFGLFIDNLVQLLLIVLLCSSRCGMTGENSYLLTRHILPGAAVSILLGNLFYAWQAHRLARREGRSDVTALPYGINTPSLLVYVFFVMGPAFDKVLAEGGTPASAARGAWLAGLLACVGSGLIEFFGAFVAERVRKRTPRAALLSTLAGIAIGFIAMQFALQIYQKPLIAMLPLAVILITYFSQAPFPLQLPGGLIAVSLGTGVAWLLTVVVQVWPEAPAWLAASTMAPERIHAAVNRLGWAPPQFAGAELGRLLVDYHLWLNYLSVIVPMGLFNVIGSLQNIESAEAAGDRFDTCASLAVNGAGTLSAALFGSCFPTTIYIGHPGWKGLGARAGYSTLNGAAITLLCLTGAVDLVNSVIPVEAGVAIVLWIGIVITAQAFSATHSHHAPAVAVGLFPAIAAWGLTVVQGAFHMAGGRSMQDVLAANAGVDLNGYLLHGLLAIERGFIFTCMVLAALSAFLIDRKFFTAGIWTLLAAGSAAAGLTHAYQLKGNVFDFLFWHSEPVEGAIAHRAGTIALGYLLMALAFFAFGVYQRSRGELPRSDH